MAEARDYVFLYAPPWSGATRFSKHHLAGHFAARGDRVLFVEAPLTPLAARRPRAFAVELRRALQPPCLAEPNLWVRRHFLPLPYHAVTPLNASRIANRLGQRLLAPALRRDVRRLGLRRPVLVAGLPHAADLVGLLPRSAVVYHCADDYAAVRGFPHSLPELEADLCRQADLVIATSETLCQKLRPWNSNTRWVPNGADVAHFATPAAPASDVSAVRSPRVGFVGGLSEWVDFGLLRTLAVRRADWSFVLIGPGAAPGLGGLSNVHLLGPRPYQTLPSYLAAIDVALIPFTHDRITEHADPIKAYEYLAAGVPVVATDMPALRRLAHVIELADSPDAFERAIAQAIAAGRAAGRVERQQEAARHGWQRRFAEIDDLIERSTAACAC